MVFTEKMLEPGQNLLLTQKVCITIGEATAIAVSFWHFITRKLKTIRNWKIIVQYTENILMPHSRIWYAYLQVDPSIIGGLVVELGDDKHIDVSISRRLKDIEKVLSESI